MCWKVTKEKCNKSETGAQGKEVPKEVRKKLEEFVDITSEDLPNEFPPRRTIAHEIDLIPGATLPYQAAHRMNLMMSTEHRP